MWPPSKANDVQMTLFNQQLTIETVDSVVAALERQIITLFPDQLVPPAVAEGYQKIRACRKAIRQQNADLARLLGRAA